MSTTPCRRVGRRSPKGGVTWRPKPRQGCARRGAHSRNGVCSGRRGAHGGGLPRLGRRLACAPSQHGSAFCVLHRGVRRPRGPPGAVGCRPRRALPRSAGGPCSCLLLSARRTSAGKACAGGGVGTGQCESVVVEDYGGWCRVVALASSLASAFVFRKPPLGIWAQEDWRILSKSLPATLLSDGSVHGMHGCAFTFVRAPRCIGCAGLVRRHPVEAGAPWSGWRQSVQAFQLNWRDSADKPARTFSEIPRSKRISLEIFGYLAFIPESIAFSR